MADSDAALSPAPRFGFAWKFLCGALIATFLGAVARFYEPATGFTSLLCFGQFMAERQVEAVREVPIFRFERSYGYDGGYYAQLATDPVLTRPDELRLAIDNLPYRARRILFCWTAWLVGGGQPSWIVHVYAVQNIVCWLLLAALLWRWFPPRSLHDVLRWALLLFSQGLLMSVTKSLADGPGLLLVALSMAAYERGRTGGAIGWLAAAGLARESLLLTGASLADPAAFTSRRGFAKLVGQALLAAAPLALWIFYIRVRMGAGDGQGGGDAGFQNFTLPFKGFLEKWTIVLKDLFRAGFTTTNLAVLGAMTALTVQALFFALRPRWRDPWWRLGAGTALLMTLLSQPVWEGYPGAASRVLLPMTLAFNVLAPRTRAGLILVVAGNLSVLGVRQELTPPFGEILTVRDAGREVTGEQVTARFGPPWYAREKRGDRIWRWSEKSADLVLINHRSRPAAATGRALLRASSTQRLKISAGDRVVWEGEITSSYRPVEFSSWVLKPGETVLRFEVTGEPRFFGASPRALLFAVCNLELELGPAPPAGP